MQLKYQEGKSRCSKIPKSWWSGNIQFHKIVAICNFNLINLYHVWPPNENKTLHHAQFKEFYYMPIVKVSFFLCLIGRERIAWEWGNVSQVSRWWQRETVRSPRETSTVSVHKTCISFGPVNNYQLYNSDDFSPFLILWFASWTPNIRDAHPKPSLQLVKWLSLNQCAYLITYE
jgi:hypothetical protein